MENLYARTVFFVKDAERSLRFYTDTLGFTLDWNHQEQERAFIWLPQSERASLAAELASASVGPHN